MMNIIKVSENVAMVSLNIIHVLIVNTVALLFLKNYHLAAYLFTISRVPMWGQN